MMEDLKRVRTADVYKAGRVVGTLAKDAQGGRHLCIRSELPRRTGSHNPAAVHITGARVQWRAS